MDFTLDDTQRMLDDTVRRFAAGHYAFEQRRQQLGSALGYSPDLLEALAELGLFGLNVPEQFGGIGGRPEDALVVMQRLGAALVMEPYAETAIAAARLLARYGTPAQQAALLPPLAEGRLRLALAFVEPGTRADLRQVATTARREGAGWRLDGRKSLVHAAPGANLLVTSACVPGGAGAELFLVPLQSPGVRVEAYPTLDNRVAAEVCLDGVQVGADARVAASANDAAVDLVAWTADQVLSAQVAEAVGVMQALLDATCHHLAARQQFGKALQEFQALQHQLADMAIWLEQARAGAHLAAADCLHPDPGRRAKAIATAKYVAAKAGRLLGQAAIQLHGGMGMTDELACGHYVKRLTAMELSWGGTDDQVQRYGDLLLADAG